MWIVGASTSNELPSAVQSMFSVMRVFVGDVSFINPACSGFTTQASVFGLNVGVAFGAITILCVINGIRTMIKANATRRYLLSNHRTNERVSEITKQRLMETSVFFMTSILTFLFEVLVVKSIQGVYCMNMNGEYRLSNELDQV